MNKVLSLVDRTTGEARSFVVKDLRMATITPIIEANLAREAWLMMDEATRYTGLGWNFSGHGIVNHGKGEYVSEFDKRVHTNTVEGFYSILKRGMKRLSTLFRAPPAPLCGRIRLPLLQSHGRRRERHRARREGRSGDRRKASDLSTPHGHRTFGLHAANA
jgi:hypothetical protein